MLWLNKQRIFKKNPLAIIFKHSKGRLCSTEPMLLPILKWLWISPSRNMKEKHPSAQTHLNVNTYTRYPLS